MGYRKVAERDLERQNPSQLVVEGRRLVVDGNEPPNVPYFVQFEVLRIYRCRGSRSGAVGRVNEGSSRADTQEMPWFSHDSPDSTDLLVHFTGRSGNYLALSTDVTEMTPQERLESILECGAIWPSRPFLISPWPVVCFSEATYQFLSYVLGSRNYRPWGVVFHRDLIYERNGGPVVHYRPDQWDEALEGMPNGLKSRFVRFTPGESEWLWEREWRVVFDPDEEGFEFEPEDVEAVIVGDPSWAPVVPGIELDLDGDPYEAPVRSDWLPNSELWWWNRRRQRLEVLE